MTFSKERGGDRAENHSVDWVALATLFQKAREKLGLSLDQIASDAGIDTEIVAKFESGRGFLTIEVICALSNVLNIDPEIVVDLVGSIGSTGFDSGPEEENDIHEGDD